MGLPTYNWGSTTLYIFVYSDFLLLQVGTITKVIAIHLNHIRLFSFFLAQTAFWLQTKFSSCCCCRCCCCCLISPIYLTYTYLPQEMPKHHREERTQGATHGYPMSGSTPHDPPSPNCHRLRPANTSFSNKPIIS